MRPVLCAILLCVILECSASATKVNPSSQAPGTQAFDNSSGALRPLVLVAQHTYTLVQQKRIAEAEHFLLLNLQQPLNTTENENVQSGPLQHHTGMSVEDMLLGMANNDQSPRSTMVGALLGSFYLRFTTR